MTKQEMLDKINKFISDKYSKQISELNKSVVITEVVDNKILAPGFKITSGGGAKIVGGKGELSPPAKLEVGMEYRDAIKPVYRIILPFEEMEVACRNENYLTQLMNFTLAQAISNYVYTFGPTDKIRYGGAYLKLPFVEDYQDDFLLTLTGEYVE
jgi:hypothetical protein